MKSFFTTALLALFSLAATSQTWQWGKRGGGSSDGNLPNGYRESVVDIATDKAGNVYALVIVEASGLPNYSIGITTTGNYLAQGSRDIGIISYRCDGTFRWRRTIGGANDDIGQSIATDTLGGVYLAGISLPVNPTYTQATFEGGGPTWPYSHTRFAFVARYDTAGAFSWVRQPMPDTAGSSRQARILDMTATGGGEVHCLAYLRPGLVGGTTNTVVTTGGVYMLRYSSTGALLSLTPMQMGMNPQTTQFYSLRMGQTPSGRILLAGTFDNSGSSANTLSFAGQPTNLLLVLASFSPQGTLLWRHADTATVAAIYGRPSFDAQGNIYLSMVSGHNGKFNGITYVNTLTTIQHAFPVATKLDSIGNTLWSVNGSTTSAASASSGVLAGGSFYMTGNYSAKLHFPGVSTNLGQVPNAGYDPFLVRINVQTGTVQSLDSLEGNGTVDGGNVLAADRSGNVYVGGQFGGNLLVAGTTYQNNGGTTDYFIAKYGVANCNCTAPTASYTKTMNNTTRTVTVTYSSATAGLDSVVWQWGDGQKLKVTSNYTAVQTHTYALGAGSSFNVCATAYSSCGQNQTCQTVGFTTSVEALGTLGNVSVYPNPATDVLFIDGAQESTAYRILSALGQEIKRGTVASNSYTLPVVDMSAGTYMLVLTDKSGARAAVRIVKH